VTAAHVHLDQRVQPPARGAGVDGGGEAGDHAVAAQPAHAVGGGVGAQADPRAELAVGEPRIAYELAEDLAVEIVHTAIVAVPAGRRLEKRGLGG
jgi:hypothetical protein